MNTPSLFFLTLLILPATLVARDAAVRTVTIRNDVPRKDNQGRYVDAHEPQLAWFDGAFYLYGSGYGNGSGWSGGIKLNCWGSAPIGMKGRDFTYWTSPLEFTADGMIERLRWEDEWSIDLRLRE